MPAIVWDVTSPAGRVGLWVLFWVGWATALAATFMINHFDLFGLRQVYPAWRGRPYTDLEFRTALLYRLVRHPLIVGFIIAFWATRTSSRNTTSSQQWAANTATIGVGCPCCYGRRVDAGQATTPSPHHRPATYRKTTKTPVNSTGRSRVEASISVA
jgi:protein-S-isoprenylcysteine O-methyltransferase Ste14